MALALLELVALEKGSARFSIDTGSNSFYQFKIGRSVQQKSGIEWVDDVFFTTPIAKNALGGQLLSPPKLVSIPLQRLDKGNVYVQLFSFKNAEGRSPAFSRPVLLPMGIGGRQQPLDRPAMMLSIDSFHAPRKIPCRSYAESYSQEASLEDLLSGILKVVGPAVLSMFGSGQSEGQVSKTPVGAASGTDGPTDVLGLLLKAILGGLQGGAGQNVSTQKSLLTGLDPRANRFRDGQNTEFSRPFIFGIDDALIGALAGPILQVLPQLMNAANQKRVQLKQADNKLISDILSETNRRLFLEQLLQAQHQTVPATQGDEAPDLTSLIQLLQQGPATSAGSVGGTAVTEPAKPPVMPTAAKILSLDEGAPVVVSNKAVVSFVTSNPIAWNGKPQVLFARNQPFQIKIRLTVAEPVPISPLPKAILKVVFKDIVDQTVILEKTFKRKDVAANTVLALPFAPDELAHAPANRPLAVLAEIRWLTSNSDKEHKALGSSEIVLVNKYFLKEQGLAVSPEKELTDMKRFRPFWNKLWESPNLDAAGNKGDNKKYLWELDVNGKYSVLLSPDQQSNGLMQTKILRGPVDRDSLTERIDGRMKAGIELSIAELNKLGPLWDGTPSLDPDKMEALATEAMAKNNAGEFIYNFKLKGKAAERGMVWVVPVFQLFEFTLNGVRSTDDTGQVTAVDEEKVRFPLPVSARAIGLKSRA